MVKQEIPQGQLDEQLTSQPIDLTQEGALEKLVKEGRIPMFVPGHAGNEAVVFCFIPPIGTTSEDSYDNVLGGAKEFFAPDGTSRGLASLQVFDPETAKGLQQRRQTALEQLH